MPYNQFAQQNYPNAQTAYQANPGQGNPAIDPNDPEVGMKALLYTSPAEEERMRKASVANQRIMAVADALRHIGNIYHTVNYASPQKFNSPVQEEAARYNQEKSLRDANNLRYITYQQQKAAQDAKQRQWETTFQYNALKDAAAAKALKEYRDRTITERGRQFDEGLNYRKENDEKNRKQAKEIAEKRDKLGWANYGERKRYHENMTRIAENRAQGRNKKIRVYTPNGTLYAPGDATALKNNIQQLYFEAERQNDILARANRWVKGFDGKYRDTSGREVNDPRLIQTGLLAGGLFGGNKRDYDAALKAIGENKHLAKFAEDNLGWGVSGYTGGVSGGDDMDLRLDEDDDDMDLGLE